MLKYPLKEEDNLIQSLNNPIESEEENKLTPYYKSNIFGKFFFNWTRYAMDTANKSPLKIIDFKGLAKEDQSQNLIKPLYEKWYSNKKESENLFLDENAFFKSIIKTYYCWIIVLTILNICIDSLKYIQIFFYDSIIQYFEYYHSPDKFQPPFFPIYVNALGLVLIKISKTFFSSSSQIRKFFIRSKSSQCGHCFNLRQSHKNFDIYQKSNIRRRNT